MAEPLLDWSRAVEVLEAASSEHTQLPAWIDSLTAAISNLVPSPLGGGAMLIGFEGERGTIEHATSGPAVTDEVFRLSVPFMSDTEVVRAFYLDAPHVATMQEKSVMMTREKWKQGEGFLTLLRAEDIIGLLARTASHSLAFTCIRPERAILSTSTRLQLGRIAVHIEAGLRLRLDPCSLVAVLRPDGTVVHAEADARLVETRQRLSAHVKQIDHARTRKQRTRPEAIDAWSALAAGRFGFVERTGSTREFLVFENPSPRAQQWSAAETRAVELSAMGTSGKLVAYALGVSDSEVSRLLASAAAKAGLATRTELIALAAQLRQFGPRHASASQVAQLTDSERAVLAQLRLGRSNDEIARARGTSTRTVANQVAAMLRKTRLPSRRALATLSV